MQTTSFPSLYISSQVGRLGLHWHSISINMVCNILKFLCLIPESVNYDINWFHYAKTSNCIHPMYSCEYMYGFHTIFLSKQCGFQIVFLWMQVQIPYCILECGIPVITIFNSLLYYCEYCMNSILDGLRIFFVERLQCELNGVQHYMGNMHNLEYTISQWK